MPDLHGSSVYTLGDPSPFRVNEKPDEVLAAVEGAMESGKIFIPLTGPFQARDDDGEYYGPVSNRTVYIRAKYVVYVGPYLLDADYEDEDA